jgi:hydroxyethylthiazole kinase-like sugar kinase family protein
VKTILLLMTASMLAAAAMPSSAAASSPVYAGQTAAHAITAAQDVVVEIAISLGGKHDVVTIGKLKRVLTNGSWTAQRSTLCGKAAWAVTAHFTKRQKAANDAAMRTLEPSLTASKGGFGSSDSPLFVTASGVKFDCSK